MDNPPTQPATHTVAPRLGTGVADPAVAAFVEQLLCADADTIVLNMFSTFSRHIARIRAERHGKGRRTQYFKRNAWLDGAAGDLRGAEIKARRGWQDAREDAREDVREDAFEQFRRTLFPRERHATERPDELVNDPFEALRRVARDPFESFEEALRRVPK